MERGRSSAWRGRAIATYPDETSSPRLVVGFTFSVKSRTSGAQGRHQYKGLGARDLTFSPCLLSYRGLVGSWVEESPQTLDPSVSLGFWIPRAVFQGWPPPALPDAQVHPTTMRPCSGLGLAPGPASSPAPVPLGVIWIPCLQMGNTGEVLCGLSLWDWCWTRVNF